MDKQQILKAIGRFFGVNLDGGRTSSREQPDNVSKLIDVDDLHAILTEAEKGNPLRMFTFVRDAIFSGSHLQTEFGKRKIAVLGDTYTISPVDKKNPEAVRIAGEINAMTDSLGSRWNNLLIHLLDGTIMPVAVSQPIWGISRRPGWYYEPVDFDNVLLTSLDYAEEGKMRIRTGKDTFNLPAEDAIIHRGHILANFPDYWGGPVRSVLFWFLFATMDRDWWIQFLNKWGQPFLIGRYDPSDPNAGDMMRSAFAAAKRLFGIVVSNNADVQVQQITSASGDVFGSFHTLANAEISKLILGQTMSSTATNVGLGGGQSSVQEEVRQDIRQFDAKTLAFTIREKFFAVVCRRNGWPEDLAPVIAFGSVSNAEKRATADLLGSLKNAGLEIDDDGIEPLSEQIGFPLRRMAQTSPAFSGFGGYSQFSAPADPTERAFRATPAGTPRISAHTLRETAAAAANDKLVASQIDPYKAALGKQYAPIREALLSSTSRADFLRRLDKLNISPTPETVEILANAMSSAAANATLSIQPTAK